MPRKAATRSKSAAGYAAVYRGLHRSKTAGGLEKSDIKRIPIMKKDSKGKKVHTGHYRYVSKAKSTAAKKAYNSNGLKAWTKAVMDARKELDIEGFVPVSKKTTASAQSKALYKAAVKHYEAAGYKIKSKRRTSSARK